MSTDTARRLMESVDREEMLRLAEDLVRIPSFKTEETDVARFLGDFLAQRGYEVELQEVEPGRFQTIATLKGSGGGKSLMLNGHIDIDPLAMGWKRDPWTPSIEGDLIFGAGIRNMKSGVSAMIEAAEMVRRSGGPAAGRPGAGLRGRGTAGGRGGLPHLCRHGPLTDMAVVPEPFGANNILTVHAGVLEMAIHVLGNSRHISRKEEAVDAIAKMCKAVPAIDGVKFTYTPREDLPGLPRINVGAIIGGRGRDYDMRGPNFVSDFCTVIVDVRFLPGMTSASVKADIERALDEVKRGDPDFQYEIEMPPRPEIPSVHCGHGALRPAKKRVHPGNRAPPVPHRHRERTRRRGNGAAGLLHRRRHLSPLGGRRPLPPLRPGRRFRIGHHPRRVQPHQRHGASRQGPGPDRPGRLQPA